MYILFNGSRPVGIVESQPDKWTLSHRKATEAKPLSECTSTEYEEAVRAEQDRRGKDSPLRWRAAGHGHSGGDGFVDLRPQGRLPEVEDE